LLLSVYSLGLGLPFLLASLGMNSFLAASSRLRRSLRTIEVVSGAILIVFGLALVTNLFSSFVAFLARYLPALG
ncbi:MAG TPA: cytochrome c biogenesis protein CcdA, partial [Candidatus Eisenbacteria bacterium]|nr:cytochrome c biogenesis protein CcdA [Candidatus Eisenbacteria bacterium]